jgi:hypothetical protein
MQMINVKILGGFALASSLCLSGVVFAAAPGSDSTDPLVAVDRNRSAIIADIVQSFQADLAAVAPGSNVADDTAKLRERLTKLRADRLLSASLASSYATLKSILEDSDKLSASAANTRSKALGDSNKDLVYTPLAPCRLVDTRGFGAPIQGGPFAPEERRSYAPAGACGIPLAGVATLMISFTSLNTTPLSGGYLAILAPGAPVSTTVDIFNQGQNWSASNAVVATGGAGQFDIYVAAARPEIVIDILGYFAPPQGGVVSSIVTAAGSGLTSATTGGAVTLGLPASQLLPTTACALNQVPIWNGAAWTCGTGGGGGAGTVTSITAGAGLTGGTITATGTIALSSTQAMPACATNQYPKWSGSAWVCADSPTFASYGGFVNPIPSTGGLFVFAGPTTGSVAVVPATRITALASTALGLTSGSTVNAQVGICMQPFAGGTISLAAGVGSSANVGVSTMRSGVTVSNSFTGIAAGNYRFGMCVLHTGPGSIDSNDFLTGWIMLAS